MLGLEEAVHAQQGGEQKRGPEHAGADFSDLAARHPNLAFIPVLSEPSGPTERRTGYLADVVADDFADLDGSKVYLAGPPIMVETCVERVRERGTGDEDCHADAFYTEADKAKLEAAS